MNPPNEEQLAALQRFADTHGRYWKAKLHKQWCYGARYGTEKDAPLLRQVRNEFGGVWLRTCRIKPTKPPMDMHKPGHYCVLEPDKTPVQATFNTTGYSARSDFVRLSNRRWSEMHAEGYRVARLEIVEVQE